MLPIANYSPVFSLSTNQIITSCSSLIGSFKFQLLWLVNTQKRTSGPSRENILFPLSLVNQIRFCFHPQPITTKPKPLQSRQPCKQVLPPANPSTTLPALRHWRLSWCPHVTAQTANWRGIGENAQGLRRQHRRRYHTIRRMTRATLGK